MLLERGVVFCSSGPSAATHEILCSFHRQRLNCLEGSQLQADNVGLQISFYPNYIALAMVDAQTVTNLLTAAMAGATVWLAVETRRMAKAAQASIDLQARPYLAFRGFDLKLAHILDPQTNTSVPGIRVALKLGNPGRVLITYHMNSITCSLTFQTGDMTKMATKGGVIFPEQETLFLLPFAPLQQTGNIAPFSDVKFDLSFWAADRQRQRLCAKVRLEVLASQPLDWQWVFLEGPSYG